VILSTSDSTFIEMQWHQWAWRLRNLAHFPSSVAEICQHLAWTSSRKTGVRSGRAAVEESPLYVLLVIGTLVDEDRPDEGRVERNKRLEAWLQHVGSNPRMFWGTEAGEGYFLFVLTELTLFLMKTF
jgi:hypothetical protein